MPPARLSSPMHAIAGYVDRVCAFAQAWLCCLGSAMKASIKAVIALCDHVPPMEAVFALALLYAVLVVCRACFAGFRYGEPFACRLALAGTVGGLAGLGLRAYLPL